MRESRSFPSKFPGKCAICWEEYKTGDWLHYVGSRVAHDFCHGEPHNRSEEGPREKPEETNYIVKGKRNHEKRCGTCFLNHAGTECP